MGKRRLTLFGMRPRHTAIVVTTITGMLIAGLTLGTMLTVDSNLRELFDRGMLLVSDNKAYQSKNRELRVRNGRLADDSTRLTREVQEKTADLRLAQQKEREAAHALHQAERRVATLEQEIGARQAELVALKKTSRATQQRLSQVSDGLTRKKRDLDAAKADLARKTDELAEKTRELAAKTSELASKMAELEEAERRLSEADNRIRQAADIIQQQTRLLQDEVNLTHTLLRDDVILKQGQEIARKAIDSRQSPDQVRAELIGLLGAASERARQAEAGADDGTRAVQLVFLDRETDRIVEDEGTCLDQAVKAIVEQGRTSAVPGVVVQVVVVTNTLRRSKAMAEFNMHWNNLAFHQSDTIARRIIDGGTSEGRILLAVMNFLSQDVRAAAERANFVPVASPDPEKAAEPISDEQLDRVMELVQMIRSQGKQVEVRAVARKDIYAAGPLNLDSIDFAINTLLGAAK